MPDDQRWQRLRFLHDLDGYLSDDFNRFFDLDNADDFLDNRLFDFDRDLSFNLDGPDDFAGSAAALAARRQDEGKHGDQHECDSETSEHQPPLFHGQPARVND
ncbi:MAG: hypothetical protein OXU19_09295 [bacterium]|nr:hypothetical protein [bacterium]